MTATEAWAAGQAGSTTRAISVGRTSGRSAGGRTVVLVCVTLLVVIRFFSEKLGALPDFTVFVDIPIAVALVVLAALWPATPGVDRSALSLAVPAYCLLLLCGISALVNADRIAWGPAVLFVYGFLAPVCVFYAVRRLWSPGNALSASRLLVALVVIQLAVVAVFDLPRFLSDPDPDLISGTFGENAYQLVFFLLVAAGLFAGIFTFEPHRTAARLAPLALIAIFAVILLAQYRALLITTFLTLVLVALLVGTARARGVLVGLVAVISFTLVFSYVVSTVPALKIGVTLEAIYKEPGAFVTERRKATAPLERLFADHPVFLATGTGPGTFTSRAWDLFAGFNSRSRANTAGPYLSRLAGGRLYHTDVSDKYVRPHLRERTSFLGSVALTSPTFSYQSVMAELGVVGLILILVIYGTALASAARMTLAARKQAPTGDPLPALLIACTTAFFVLVQMGLLENWLEATRLTFLSWALLAIATREFEARQVPRLPMDRR